MCRSRLCDGEFWLERPSCLFSDFRFIPNRDMTLEEKLNCITRLVILVFIVLLLYGRSREATYFLLIALVVIIALYYIMDKNGQTRHHVHAPLGSMMSPETPPHIRKRPTEINQRRPYPHTVPEDFEVKAARGLPYKVVVGPAMVIEPEPVSSGHTTMVDNAEPERFPVEAGARDPPLTAFEAQILKMQNLRDIRGDVVRVQREDALHQIFGT